MSLQMRLLAAYARSTSHRAWASAAAVQETMAEPRISAPVPHELYQVNHVVTETIVTSESREFTIHSLVPATDAPRDTPLDICIYLHGGGYINALDNRHWSFASDLAGTGLKVIVPDYGLPPEATAADATKLLDAVYRRYARDAARTGHRILLAGDSAGAGLAAGWLVTTDLVHSLPVDRVALLSPWLDITCSTPGLEDLIAADPLLHPEGLREAGRAWAGSVRLDDPVVSPLNASDLTVSSLPPIGVWSGTRDILHADAQAWKRRVDAIRDEKRSNDVFRFTAGAVHNFQFTHTPEGRVARAEIIDWLSRGN